MTRKRNRNRIKAKENRDIQSTTVSVDKEVEVEDQFIDSGNESPPAGIDLTERWKDHSVSYHQTDSESVKAWKCYQACILERYHWFLDNKRTTIARDFTERISQACLHLSADLLSKKTAELQQSMANELQEVEAEEQLANARFRENLKSLEAGEAMADLPSIDPHVTLEQVLRFISNYEKPVELHSDGGKESRDRGKELSVSFSSSICSEDSGVMLHDKTSPRSVGLPSLSEIWKPESDELRIGSYATSSFFEAQPDVEEDLRVRADMSQQVFHQPSITDDDSAIQAVVYTQAPHPTARSVNIPSEAMGPALETSLLGLSALSNLASEYNGDSDSLYQPFASAGSISVDPLNSYDLAISQTMSSTSGVGGSLGPLDGSVNERGLSDGAAIQKCDEESKISVISEQSPSPKSSKAKKAKKKSKATEEQPVKFTDCKTLNKNDKKLVNELTFGWSKGGGEDAPSDRDNPSKAAVSSSEDKTEGKVASNLPKPLSFAAVAASPAAVKQPEVKSSNSSPAVESNVMFSTKKSSRKFAKSSCLNKTSMCWAFLKLKKCPWGVDCIFAHGKRELQPFPKWFKEKKTPSSAVQLKMESAHGEPCANHYCHGRRQFLLRKTVMCKLWESGRCFSTKEKCQFAHGKSDIQPLPKKEMCRMFMNGKCNLQSTECVYAHSKSELSVPEKKKKKALKKATEKVNTAAPASSPVSRLRTISETSTGSNESWSSVARHERVRTISGTSLQSNEAQAMRDLEEFDWLAWDSQYEVPVQEQLDDDWNHDDCVICAIEFTDENPKFQLECEHESFHFKCISQWVVEKDPSCPICRHPTDLTDNRFSVLQYTVEDTA